MPGPILDDDGRTVTLDLHGATVDEALELVDRVVREAVARGRSSVHLIHGSSTSTRSYDDRTIKHALHRALDAGRIAPDITDALRLEDTLTLSLPLTADADNRRIRLIDVV